MKHTVLFIIIYHGCSLNPTCITCSRNAVSCIGKQIQGLFKGQLFGLFACLISISWDIWTNAHTKNIALDRYSHLHLLGTHSRTLVKLWLTSSVILVGWLYDCVTSGLSVYYVRLSCTGVFKWLPMSGTSWKLWLSFLFLQFPCGSGNMCGTGVCFYFKSLCDTRKKWHHQVLKHQHTTTSRNWNVVVVVVVKKRNYNHSKR